MWEYEIEGVCEHVSYTLDEQVTDDVVGDLRALMLFGVVWLFP